MARESIYVIQPSFATGEVSPDVSNRTDMEKYAAALVNAENTYVRPYGSVYKRGGTLYCGEAKYSDKDCILEEFGSEGESYLLEIGDKYIRVWKDGKWLGVEVTTPFTEAELPNLRFCQSADVKFIASGTHPIMTLSRYSDTDWRFGEYEITNPYFDITNTMAEGRNRIRPSAISGDITLESETGIFSNTLIGANVQIKQEIAAKTISASGAQTTGSLLCGDAWKLITHGTWTGEIKIQKSDDNTTWKDYRTYKSNNDFNASESGTFDSPTYLRLVTTAGKADLTAYAYTHTGEVKLTSVTDGTHASARVVKNLGSTDWTQDYCFSAWNALMGYPRVLGFFQDRLMLGATKAQPYMVWGSRTGDYPNFSTEKASGTLTDDSAVALSFISREQKEITHIVPAADLIVMTSGNEWMLSGSETLTPTKATPKPQSSRGSNGVTPILIGTRIIYVQTNGRTVRDMGYSFESDAYDGMDLTLLAKSLVNGNTLISAAYMQDPDSRLYFVRSDGVMLCLSYVQDQKVYAWSHIVTKGKFKAVANITGEEDVVYAVVERTLRGKTVKTIERFTGYAESTDPNDYTLLDSAVTLTDDDGADVWNVPHLAGETVGVLGDGRYYENIPVDEEGNLQIPDEVRHVTVGIPYTMKIVLPNIDVQAQNGTIQGRYKKIPSVTLRLTNSLGGYLGGNETLMDEIKYDELSEQNVTLFNGDKDVTVPEGFNTKGQIAIHSTDPYPFTLTAIIREVVISE